MHRKRKTAAKAVKRMGNVDSVCSLVMPYVSVSHPKNEPIVPFVFLRQKILKLAMSDFLTPCFLTSLVN